MATTCWVVECLFVEGRVAIPILAAIAGADRRSHRRDRQKSALHVDRADAGGLAVNHHDYAL